MRRFAFCFLGMTFGYGLGGASGHVILAQASSNMHDRPVEAAMTSALVTGPIGALAGGVVGFLLGGRARSGMRC